MSRIELSTEGGSLLIQAGNIHTYTRWFQYFWREEILRTVEAELPNAKIEIHSVDLVEAR